MSKVAEAEPRTASQTELKVQEVTYVAFKEIYFLGTLDALCCLVCMLTVPFFCRSLHHARRAVHQMVWR